MRVSEKWKFSALENEFAPLENHPRGPRAWNDQHTTWTKVNFFNFQNWLVQSPWGGKTLRGGLDQWSGGYSGVISGFSRIVQNLVEPQFISQHPYTSGTCSFGSKLSIHVLSQGLSFTDLRWTCLFYPRGVKVKFADSESAYFGAAEVQLATFRARLGYNFPRRPTIWRVQNHLNQYPIVYGVSGISAQKIIFWTVLPKLWPG